MCKTFALKKMQHKRSSVAVADAFTSRTISFMMCVWKREREREREGGRESANQ